LLSHTTHHIHTTVKRKLFSRITQTIWTPKNKEACVTALLKLTRQRIHRPVLNTSDDRHHSSGHGAVDYVENGRRLASARRTLDTLYCVCQAKNTLLLECIAGHHTGKRTLFKAEGTAPGAQQGNVCQNRRNPAPTQEPNDC
jgi:hypothetical protein